MLKRDAYEMLSDWKRNSKGRALLVNGARQTGKTFLIEQFARQEYPDFIKVDFLKNDVAAAALSRAESFEQVIDLLSLMSGKKVMPGNTLIFLDEVQEAPNLITLSKYLVQDGRFDIIMSGSLLGVELNHVKSLPVGYLRTETMYPLSFAEFCNAQGVPASVVESVREAFEEKQPVPQGFHDRLVQLFRLYLVVGGMPRAVQEHLDTKGDLGAVREVQNELVELYKEDIAKHAGDRALQVKAIFDAMPSQLDKENKRFQLQALKKEAKFDRFANDFAWLVSANAALKVTNITDPRPMLKRSEELGRFKLYQADVGMLMSRYRSTTAIAALAGAKSVNFGAVYENAVAQELAAAGVPLHYYRNSRKGEVDFIVETDDGAALPIEVKSGKDYRRHAALNNLMETDEYGISRAYVLSEANVSAVRRGRGAVFYLPLYMLPLIAEEARGESLVGVRASAPAW